MTALKYQIALSMVPGIGNVNAKKLIAYCNGAEAVFNEKHHLLLKIPGIGKKLIAQLHSNKFIDEAEKEIEFMREHNVEASFYLDPDYPKRLKHCDDGPIVLYKKGNMQLDALRCISIVGTRKATVKGKALCEDLIADLAMYEPTIISGLAYGIDIVAHKTALKCNLDTIGVLASGLDQIYPRQHHSIAQQMQKKGGLVSDYRSNAQVLPVHFAERNRIVAGLADVTIVVESSLKGGSLITAELANGYHRDVMAIPGRPSDSQSSGCNMLIKQNKAALVESAKDIADLMGWQEHQPQKTQTRLFEDLNKEEQIIVGLFAHDDRIGLDEISLRAEMPISQITALLLSLEFKGAVISLPGKIYQLSH